MVGAAGTQPSACGKTASTASSFDSLFTRMKRALCSHHQSPAVVTVKSGHTPPETACTFLTTNELQNKPKMAKSWQTLHQDIPQAAVGQLHSSSIWEWVPRRPAQRHSSLHTEQRPPHTKIRQRSACSGRRSSYARCGSSNNLAHLEAASGGGAAPNLSH